ncbi:MAG: hypothetical protein ACI87H_003474 [Gammaproteobacteria bacterium]|jgi:hypothetical protein
MKKLYTNENRMIVFNLKNVLEGEGIASIVVNEFASGGVGDLAAFDTWPELWVEDETQFEQANSIVQNIFNGKDDDWFCRGCQEQNDAAFRICWQCGRSVE